MIDLEELKRRRFKMHAEWTPEGQEASAEQFAMLKEFDRQFPAIVAKLEAAQRLRDAVVGHFGTEGILKWPEIAGSVVAFNRADKEQS